MNLKQVHDELYELSLQENLTNDEISYIIVTVSKLLGEIAIRDNKLKDIREYCKKYKAADKNNYLRDIEEICQH